MSYILFHDDCLDRMAKLDESSMDSIVTDPPYGLSFMGKGWDHGVPGKAFWVEALRVAKPGAHLLAFGGTRTYHRLACAIEDAGWEVRDCVMWVYGSGFPKSHNLDGEWSGWGTALKPAWEPIIVARKPLCGTVAENVLRHGTGAINVDGCRVGYASDADKATALAGDAFKRKDTSDKGWSRPWMEDAERIEQMNRKAKERAQGGRWPANLIHDGSDEVVGLFPESKGQQGDVRGTEASHTGGDGTNCYGEFGRVSAAKRGDSGSAARFFYCAKASKADRDEGCEGLQVVDCGTYAQDEWTKQNMDGFAQQRRNHHPTVKPTELMRYLCRLVTPPGGVVLDPFMGSGSTGKAALIEGFQFVGIEKSAEYIEIAKSRLYHAEHPGSVIAASDDEHQRELFDMEQYIREDAKR